MKTAEELFLEYADHWIMVDDKSDLTKTVAIEDFYQALHEHDAEIISLIDEMIEEDKETFYTLGCVETLTELKNKIKE